MLDVAVVAVFQQDSGGRQLLGQFERLGFDSFRNTTAANALYAGFDGLDATIGQLSVDFLQVGPELPAGNTSDLGTHAAEVFLLTAFVDRISNLGLFAADVTFPSHQTEPAY